MRRAALWISLSCCALAGALYFTETDSTSERAPDPRAVVTSSSAVPAPISSGERKRRTRARHRHLSLRDEHGKVPHDAIMTARAQLAAAPTQLGLAAGLDSTKWANPGPGNFGGRTRALVVHPTNTNTMFTGSVSGGIWKTTNGGASWAQVDDLLENLAVTDLVFDPRNANTMYASTGEISGSWGNIRGAGIFKSTNGGTTWTRLASTNTPAFYYVNKLSISADGRTLLAACYQSAIYRSTNGGTSWTRVFNGGSAEAICYDVDFHPANSSLAVANCGLPDQNQTFASRCYYSRDGGATWRLATGIGTTQNRQPTNRIELTWHGGRRTGNGVVYALEYDAAAQPTTTILRSTDNGASYTVVNSTADIVEDQGDYDNTIWVDPSDTDTRTDNDTIVCGGIHVWRSTNGGRTFTQVSRDTPGSNGSCHTDQHNIVHHPGFNGTTNRTVFVATDGGIYKTDNIYTVTQTRGWVKLDNSLTITQFYGGSRHPSGILYGGTQDNGTLARQPRQGLNSWAEAIGGDGGFSASDLTDARYHYGEAETGRAHRSSDGGRTAVDIYRGDNQGRGAITDAGSENTCGFVAPLVLDRRNARRLFVGCHQLWRTSDARANPVAWRSIKAGRRDNGNPPRNIMVTAVEISPHDSTVIFVGYDDGAVDYTTNGTNNTPTWTARDNNLPFRYCTRVRIDPGNRSRVFATFGGFANDNIWESRDLGATWRNLRTPMAAPVRDIAVHPSKPNWLYAATEVGLVVSEDGGRTWTGTATPTRCAIDELFWSSGSLWMVTHGRGFFEQKPCVGSVRVVGRACRIGGAVNGPSLTADQAILGRTTRFTVSGAASNVVAAALLLGAKPRTPIQVSPGCFVRFDLLLPTANMGVIALTNGRGQLALPIPSDASLRCVEVALQGVLPTTTGAIYLSNGVELTLGN